MTERAAPLAADEAQAAAGPAQLSALGQEWAVIATLWRRDMLRFAKERSRWLGVVAQPMLFWFIIGSGMSGHFQMGGEGGDNYMSFFFPGVLVMVVLFTSLFATFSVIEDRDSGFLQAVLAAPASRAAMVLGKVSGVVTMVFIQATLFLALAPIAGYPFLSISWLGIVLAIFFGCAAITSLNIAIGWRMPSTQAFHAVMSVILLPAWVVSGAMFPAENGWLRWAAACNPLSYIVHATRLAMNHAPLAAQSGALAIVAVMAVAATAAATASCKRPRA